MSHDQNETQSKAIFKKIGQIEAPPYLASRVVALTAKPRRKSLELLVWRWIAGLSLAALATFVTVTQLTPKQENQLFAFQPYVVQVDLTGVDMELADSAELELPEGVNFVSRNKVVKSLRQLKLPLARKDSSGRLPFVVISERTGAVPLQVKFFDANDRVIETKSLVVHFVAGQRG